MIGKAHVSKEEVALAAHAMPSRAMTSGNSGLHANCGNALERSRSLWLIRQGSTQSWLRRSTIAAALAALTFACSGGAGGLNEAPNLEEMSASEHGAPGESEMFARINVERTTTSSGQSAQAMAQFVQLPVALSKQARVNDLRAGSANFVPDVGQCQNASDWSEASLTTPEAIPSAELQLLEAGEVAISADAAGTVTLAPHAFPSISGFVSGVVYTTRDRSAAALPSNTVYRLFVGGSAQVPALELAAKAPKELGLVTLGGVPLGQVESITTASPLDVTWEVGADSDIVYVDLGRANDTEPLLRCAFADDAGVGSVPTEELRLLTGAGRVSLHRLRTAEGFAGGFGQAELRFDFELSHPVSFSH